MSDNSMPIPPAEASARKYDYYAFISYKHLDKPWAKWVQKQLEHYRLPNKLCREKQTPKHVSPIFRDETDLTGGKTVRTLLEEKIRQSKYLIVICSPHMQVKPEYIDYEIETFLAAGNPASRILPLIVGGEANSPDPAKECLPPALKRMGEAMPLGITLNRKDRKETVLKLIASILELDLQSLRSHNHDRQQRRIVAALGCGLAFSLGLGGLMAWEMLSVKQASLREQLTYAADTFRQGDKLSAGTSAAAVAGEYSRLMDSTIQAEAGQLSLMAAIHPKYQPLTRLCNVSANSRLLFDTTGQHVMVITENTVKKYDMLGHEIMSFDTSQVAQQIVDVCTDGVHAVVMTIYLPELDGTRLWLWNMETNAPVCQLAYSTRYDQDNVKAGYLSDVVSARFSPDGKTVCAWRDGNGGYFNASEELAAWDVQTGTQLFSFSSELLGRGNRSYEIEAFEFIDSDTLHWTGSGNHVYYTLGEDEPLVISKHSLPSVRDQSVHAIAHKRFTLREGNPLIITDLATGETLEFATGGLETHWADFNGRYLFLWITGSRGDTQGIALVDLASMNKAPWSDALAQVCSNRRLTFTQHLEGSPYVYATLDDTLCRLDMTTGEAIAIQADPAQQYTLIAHTDRMDVLAASINSRTRIIEVEEHAQRTYTIDADHDRFISSAAFSSGAYMAADHNGSYYLYPLTHPGTRLDADMTFDGDAVYAASADGALTVKGGGTGLAAWYNGRPVLSTQLAGPILRVGAANDRFFALTRDALFLYDVNGALLCQYNAPQQTALYSAKITADGSRIALLQGSGSELADNSCSLFLLDGTTLTSLCCVSQAVHIIPTGVYETAYDLSLNGQWLSAVVRVTMPGESQYQLSASVWSAQDGKLYAQAQNVNNDDVPVFDLIHHASGISSAYRLQFVHFARSGMLLSGLQYGTWILDLEKQTTVDFISEGANCDTMPDMLSNGLLLYPAGGLHVWDVAQGRLLATMAHTPPLTELEAMLKTASQNRLYISPDQQWLSIAGADDTWLYHTGDWTSGTVLAAQRAQVLHLDNTLLIYATDDGLWRIEFDPYNRKEPVQ